MINEAGADAGGAESGFDIETEECSSRWKTEQHPEQETVALVQVQNSKQVEKESVGCANAGGSSQVGESLMYTTDTRW